MFTNLWTETHQVEDHIKHYKAQLNIISCMDDGYNLENLSRYRYVIFTNSV